MRARLTIRSTGLLLAGVTLGFVSACGGGGDSPTGPTPPPPPPPATVASVTVSPATAALQVPATVQLSAAVRDQQGNLMSTAVTWTTSSSAIASVSQAGLVTAVGAGSATITATAGGQSGSAAITVTVQPTSPYGPVLDRKDIGPAGGTVGTADVAVTIPAGAFLTPRPVEVVRDTSTPAGLLGAAGSPRYVIDGLPASQLTTVTVRLRTNGTLAGSPAIALQQPAVDQADSVVTVLGQRVLAARDSAGFLVAEVALRGREAAAASPFATARAAPTAAEAFDPTTLLADGFLTALLNVRVRTSPSGRFDIWSGLDDPNLEANLTTVAGWMDEAYAALTATYGYNADHRASWPMQVLIENTAAGWNGVFRQFAPYPYDHNYSVIGMPRAKLTRAEQPGTAIHELYHFMQQRYRAGLTLAQYARMSWLMEATSTWMSENHPRSPRPFTNTTAHSWRDSLYGGLNPNMVANSGYGKAPMIKYIAQRWGHAKVREIWDAVQAGTAPVGALLNAVPEPAAQWWPLALSAQLGGSLYPWPVDSLMPRGYQKYDLTLKQGRVPYEAVNQLWPLDVEMWFVRRDTALFGPKFELPVYLDSASIGRFRLLAFDKPAAATHFRPIAGTDTVRIPGHRLQTRDSILLLTTSVDVAPPYTALRKPAVRVDLRLPDGDWYLAATPPVADNMRFQCDQPGDSVTFDAAGNVAGVLQLFAQAGTWKRKPTPSYPATYEWTVRPEIADSLAAMAMTLTSTITETQRDTIRMTARFKWDMLGSAGASALKERISRGDLGGWWWWLLPIGLVPAARSRRVRRALPVAGALVLLSIAGCVGFVGWTIDETIDVTLTKVRFTADPNDVNATLLEVREATGKTTLNDYRTEAWVYTFDPGGAKTDSTKRTCTGTGSATYGVTGVVYGDGITPPDDDDDETLAARVERAFGVPGLAARIEAARAGRP
jgi:hypothetical protein